MPTLSDYINNKTQYPDETTITLQDGSTSTLGEVRKGFMFEGDYRRKTTELGAQRRQLDNDRTEWETARLDAEAKLTELAKSLIQQNPQVQTRDELEDLMQSDPIAKKLSDKYAALEAKLALVEKQSTEATQRQSLYERAYITDQHQRVLANIRKNDPDVDVEGLVRFAKERYIPRLDDAYDLMTRDKQIEKAVTKAKEDARKEAYEKAKQELMQPVITSRRVLSSSLPKDAPKTFDEARDAALADPEVIKLMTSEGAGY